MYYYVPKEGIEDEKAEPGTVKRLMGVESTSNVFLWGQAMYIIAQLLTSGLVHVNEIDLVRRYLPSYNRPRRSGRYSAFQVRKTLQMEVFNCQIDRKDFTKALLFREQQATL
jgi:phosphorylase kinase alpha/beta subunit